MNCPSADPLWQGRTAGLSALCRGDRSGDSGSARISLCFSVSPVRSRAFCCNCPCVYFIQDKILYSFSLCLYRRFPPQFCSFWGVSCRGPNRFSGPVGRAAQTLVSPLSKKSFLFGYAKPPGRSNAGRAVQAVKKPHRAPCPQTRRDVVTGRWAPAWRHDFPPGRSARSQGRRSA